MYIWNSNSPSALPCGTPNLLCIYSMNWIFYYIIGAQNRPQFGQKPPQILLTDLCDYSH